MSDLLQRIDRLYELDAEPLMFAVGASALLIECRTQIESLTSENTFLRNWANTLEATMRAQGVCLCTFAQKTTGDGCQVCEPPPSHKGED